VIDWSQILEENGKYVSGVIPYLTQLLTNLEGGGVSTSLGAIGKNRWKE